MVETVAVTGGNGGVGRAAIAELAAHDYRTVNVSRGDRQESVADAYCQADLLDAGETYGGLATADADAVVHCGTRSRPDDAPGYRTFESNATTVYHVLEAAGALGIDRVCLASSLDAVGAGFEPDPVAPAYLPVDELHPATPSNPYGLGKQVAEVIADGVARRADGPRSIASLRFPIVMDEPTLRETFVEADRSLSAVRSLPAFRTIRNTLFSYVHRGDAAGAIRRAVETDLDGHERLFVAAADTTTTTPTSAVIDDCYPDAERRRSFAGTEGLLDVSKARRLLDWTPRRSWRDLA